MQKWLLLVVVFLVALIGPSQADDLVPPPPGFPNVVWSIPDEVAACPAGDSVLAGHPSKVRVAINYYGHTNVNDPPPRVGVPPESIFVAIATFSGNVFVNDERFNSNLGYVVLADDSTDANGFCRITLPSVSGCGVLHLTLFISGTSLGMKSVTVRSVDGDHDASSKVTSADQSAPCDLNYNDTADDASIVAGHLAHWHRNALHGTPSARTSLCGTCEFESGNTLGDSEISWSPDGRHIAHSVFVGPEGWGYADCNIFYTTSTAPGDTMRHFTFPASGVHDYDPSWSPLGDYIIFDRHDNRIIRKGVYGRADTSEVALVAPFPDDFHRGAVTPAYSPNGAMIAYSQIDLAGQYTGASHLYILPVGADSTQRVQLTTGPGVDFFPQWSPDGQWIYFDRSIDGQTHVAYKVRADQGALPSVTLVYGSDAGQIHSVLPGVSPDGKVVTLGHGENELYNVTLDASLGASQDAIINYADWFLHFDTSSAEEADYDYIETPRMSADGTRLAFRARPPGHPTQLPQLWAVRRNMNLPPVISSIGGTLGSTSIAHVTPYIDRAFAVGQAYELSVTASDPEGDALTYGAYFLRTDLGMSFNASTHKLSWTPPSSAAGKVFNVKFIVTTASGGTDYAIARIAVQQGGGCEDCEEPPILHGAGQVGHGGSVVQTVSHGVFFMDVTLGESQDMSLGIYDVRGRHVSNVAQGAYSQGKHRFQWKLDDRSGSPIAGGVYFAVLRVPSKQRVLRLIVLP